MTDLRKPYNEAEILRYLQGGMQPSEQHGIELAALNDEFLHDAIEGYRFALEQEKADELLAKVEVIKSGKAPLEIPKKIIPFWQQNLFKYAVAASLVLGGGWLVFSLQNDSKNTQNTDTVTVSPSTVTVDSSVKTSVNSPEPDLATVETITPPPKANTSKQALKPTTNTTTTFESERDVATKNAETKDLADNKISVQNQPAKIPASAPPAPIQNTDMAKVEDEVTAKKSYNVNSIKQLTSNNAVGKVVNAEQFPLEAISLTVRETGKTYTSDELGRFNVKIPDTIATVVATGIGFETKEFTLSSNKALNQIELSPKASQLEEVVIAGYGEKKKRSAKNPNSMVISEIDTTEAIPLRGWDEFEGYLYNNPLKTKNAIPENKTPVVVSFEINDKGRPENFYIIKSGGKANDAEVIKRIKSGPNWKPKGKYPVFAKITVFL